MTLLTLLALISCNGSTGPDTGQSGLLLGEEQTCPTPTEGLARFEESGAERGLDLVYEASTTTRRCPVIPGGIAAGDLDGDGDEDLAFHRLDGFPALYSNDGQGHFQRAEVDVSWEDSEGREPLAIGLADRNGDGLPEIWVVSESLLRVSENLGDLDFGPFVTLRK